MPANTQDGTMALSSRARFCAIIFCRVRPDNVAKLRWKLSLLGTRPRSIRPTHFGGTVGEQSWRLLSCYFSSSQHHNRRLAWPSGGSCSEGEARHAVALLLAFGENIRRSYGS